MPNICCPRCGKILGEKTDEYVQFGRERNRIYLPVCPRAVEFNCPGILPNKEKCGNVFTLEEAK